MAEVKPIPVTVDCLIPGCQVTLDVPARIVTGLLNEDKNEVRIKLEPDIKAAMVQYKAHLAEIHPDVSVAADSFSDYE
jgi:coenzyme F420-reducing hydrogenase gamma subunit